MTTPLNQASAKDRVLAWVREKNPQTMELKFGCDVQRENGCVETINDVSFTGNGGQSVFYTGKSTFYSNLYSADKWTHEDGGMFWATRNGGEQCKILGSDMGLEHLMKALQLEPCTDTKLDDDGRLTVTEYPPRCQAAGVSVITHFDFDKNLHNQSDDFFQSLLPLVNE